MQQSDEIPGSVCLELSVTEMQHLMDMSDCILKILPHLPPEPQHEAWEDLCHDIGEEGERIFSELDSQIHQDEPPTYPRAIPAPPHARHKLASTALEDAAQPASTRWSRRS